MQCATLRGGWPYQAVVARLGDTIYLGDTIPASADAVERAIAVLAGREPPEATADKQATGETAGLYTAGDLENYRDLLHRAQYHNYQGEFPEAERLYREALGLQRARLSDNHAGLAFVLMHLALELSNQERFQEAESLFAQADEAVKYAIDPAEEARLISYRAIHLANQQRFQKAAELAREASSMRRDLAGTFPGMPNKSDHADPDSFVTAGGTARAAAVSFNISGMAETALGDIVQSKYLEAAMLIRQERLEQAEQALKDAQVILDTDLRVPRRWLPQIQLLLGSIAERRGDLQEAAALYTDSASGHRALSPHSRNEALALLALGRIQEKQDRTAEAMQSFRAAIDIVKDGRRGIRFEDAQPFFDAALKQAERDPSARQKIYTEMFEVGQLARSTRAAQTIALAAARLAATDRKAGSVIRDLQDARRKRDAAAEAVSQARANVAALGPQLEALEQRLQQLDATVAELERNVQAAAPRYQQLIDAPVPTDAVLSALRPGEALYQIIVGPNRSLGFFIDADGIEAFPVALSEQDAQRMVAVLRTPFDEVVGGPFDVAQAYTVYEKLFRPIAGRLAKAGHVITVATGPLQSLPFAILVTTSPSPAGAGSYSNVAWFVQKHATTQAPSVQSFVSLRDNVVPSHAPKTMIGFGDFVPDRDVDGTLKALALPDGCRNEVKALAGLSRLPGSAAELRAVQASFRQPSGVDIYLRDQFIKSRVSSADLADYRIVYFATHALLPHDFDCWSEPVLVTSSAPTITDSSNDGLLVASEIADLNLDADLVVLSACSTAGTDGQGSGESLSGLARAFFYAGARSLLVTHWPIPDAPTQALMSRTFAALSDGATTAEALREAQRSLITDPQLSHPLNWGAFTVVGDGGRTIAPAAGGPST